MVPINRGQILMQYASFIIGALIVGITMNYANISTNITSLVWGIGAFLLLVSNYFVMKNNNLDSSNISDIISKSTKILAASIVILCVLFYKYPKDMEKGIGIEVYYTVLLAVMSIFSVWAITQLNDTLNNSILELIILTVFVILAGLGIFWNCGIFKSELSSNNYPLFVNYSLVVGLVVFLGILIKSNYSSVLDTSTVVSDINFKRETIKYYSLFFMLIMFLIGLYIFNPFSIMSNYGGETFFTIIGISIVLLLLAIIYQQIFTQPGKGIMKDYPTLGTFLNGFYILGAIFLSGWLMFVMLKYTGIFNENSYTSGGGWLSLIINFILFGVLLAMLYKVFNLGGYLKRNPIFSLIINTILYIPCLFISLFNYLLYAFNLTKTKGTGMPGMPEGPNVVNSQSEFKFLILGIVLLGGYFLTNVYAAPYLSSKFFKQGGNQIINLPVPLDKEMSAATYQELNGTDNFEYQYAMSFWFYIDAYAQSVGPDTKTKNILSYGENPSIKYDGNTNSIVITVKQDLEKPIIDTSKTNSKNYKDQINADKNKDKDDLKEAINNVKTMSVISETDSDGNRLIYRHSNVLLQKWNNIVINYSGGTMDVFYNGELLKSSIDVVPYMTYDTIVVGENLGAHGSLANLMYFRHPLDLLTIGRLYNSFKGKNPPSI